MKIGFIISSNGGTFLTTYKILNKIYPNKYNFFIILDRKCELSNINKKNVSKKTIIERDNNKFSEKAYNFFKSKKVEIIILFFTRLITKALYSNIPTFNIHPSLLPAFKGFNPINQAITYNFKYLGISLHKVNEKTDGGKIIAQGVYPIYSGDINVLNKISYVQKVYITLLMIELSEIKKSYSKKLYIKSLFFNPAIQNRKIVNEIKKLSKPEKIDFNL